MGRKGTDARHWRHSQIFGQMYNVNVRLGFVLTSLNIMFRTSFWNRLSAASLIRVWMWKLTWKYTTAPYQLMSSNNNKLSLTFDIKNGKFLAKSIISHLLPSNSLGLEFRYFTRFFLTTIYAADHHKIYVNHIFLQNESISLTHLEQFISITRRIIQASKLEIWKKKGQYIECESFLNNQC